MTTRPSCPPPTSTPWSSPSPRSSSPCRVSWSRSEVLEVLDSLNRARALAARLEGTERERPTHPLSLRVQVVTDEALHEWCQFALGVLALLEADRLDGDDDVEPVRG